MVRPGIVRLAWNSLLDVSQTLPTIAPLSIMGERKFLMAADPTRVQVVTDQNPQYHANHRNFPDLRADGESPKFAAFNLAEDSKREIEVAPDDFHREPLQQALVDVQAFVAQAC